MSEYLLSEKLKDQIYEVIRDYNERFKLDDDPRGRWQGRKPKFLVPFRLLDHLEEKTWDFSVSVAGIRQEWQTGWADVPGANQETINSSPFMKGVAWKNTIVWCWYDRLSKKWYVIDGGDTFVVAKIDTSLGGGTSGGTVAKGDTGKAKILHYSGSDPNITISVKATLQSLDDGDTIYCHWDSMQGHWDAIKSGVTDDDIGCGLIYATDDYDPTKKTLQVNLKDIVGDGTGGAQDGLFVQNGNPGGSGNDVCDKIAISTGCGLKIGTADELEVDPTGFVGGGVGLYDDPKGGLLVKQNSGGCPYIEVSVSCGLFIKSTGELAVDVSTLLKGSPGWDSAAGGLIARKAGSGDTCDYLEVSPGCGIKIDTAGNVAVDLKEIAGQNNGIDAKNGLVIYPGGSGECDKIGISTGCGLVFSTGSNESLEVDLRQLAGPGLKPWFNPNAGPSGCWGLQIDCDWINANCNSSGGVSVACCANSIPTTLYAHWATDGACIKLTYNSTSKRWEGSGTLNCGSAVSVAAYVSNSTTACWGLEVNDGTNLCDVGSIAPTSCSPLSYTASFTGCDICFGTDNVTVNETAC